MRNGLLAVVVILGGAASIFAIDVGSIQTDWSGGPRADGIVTDWGTRFSFEDDVSWLALPGRLALASTPVSIPTRVPFSGPATGAIKVYAADVDLDGDTDVLGASYYGNQLVLFVNDGGGPPGWNRQVIDGQFEEALAVAVADVDGDGLPDILGGADAGAEVVWWRNLGGSPPQWSRQTIDDDVPGAHDVAGADLDGDGDTDVIGVSYEDDEVIWWRNDGGSPVEWRRFVIASGFDYPTKISAADVDRDGDLDLFGVAWRDREVAWWRNHGGDPIEWTSETIETDFVGAHWVHAADVDGDGWTDVVGAAMDLGQIAWWRNDGVEPLSWNKHIVTSSFGGAVSAHAADIDGDGDLDVAGAGWSTTGAVAWFENIDGEGTSWRREIVDVHFDQASSVHLADVDGNGNLDLLGSSWELNLWAWWRITNFVPSGELTGSVLDTGGTSEWIECAWQHHTPPSTTLTVEGRSSDDPLTMGTWTTLDPGPGCGGLGDGDRYLQYRVIMDTGDQSVSPILDEISFSWLPRVPPAPRRATGRVTP